jgi:hypothetical protein
MYDIHLFDLCKNNVREINTISDDYFGNTVAVINRVSIPMSSNHRVIYNVVRCKGFGCFYQLP